MAYRDVILADSPVAYWRLGEASGTNADNEVGTLDGTYVNTPTLGVAGALSGDSNTAATFVAASTEYITVPDDAVVDLGNVFTIEMWVKRASIGTNQTLISKGGNAYVVFLTDTNRLRLTREEVLDIVDSTTTLTDTASWHHLVATKNGATVKLYIDGVDVTGTITDSTMSNSTVTLYIARHSQFTDLYFDGSLDEVALYSTALTVAQVRNHWSAGIGSVGVRGTYALFPPTIARGVA